MLVWGVDRRLLNSHRDHMAHWRVGTVRVQVGGPMSFIGVTFKNMGEGLFIGASMTQSRCITESPLQHWWGLNNAAPLDFFKELTKKISVAGCSYLFPPTVVSCFYKDVSWGWTWIICKFQYSQTCDICFPHEPSPSLRGWFQFGSNCRITGHPLLSLSWCSLRLEVGYR